MWMVTDAERLVGSHRRCGRVSRHGVAAMLGIHCGPGRPGQSAVPQDPYALNAAGAHQPDTPGAAVDFPGLSAAGS